MSTRLRFLGAAGYEVEGPSWRILIDPFLTGNPSAPEGPEEIAAPDLILVSHAAFDHLGDAAAICERTGAPIVCGWDVRLKLIDEGIDPERIRATIWGVRVEVAGIVVRPVECRHWSMAQLSDGSWVNGSPLSYIVEPEPGLSLYHWGDTCIFDMRLLGELYSPTVAILGVSDPEGITAPTPIPAAGRMFGGEMSSDEAAFAAEMLGVRTAIASHYTAQDEQTRQFPERVRARDSSGRRLALAPDPGDSILLGADGLPITEQEGI